jgi:hypothetical protein
MVLSLFTIAVFGSAQALHSQPSVEALLYSTMASTFANRPAFAMDGDATTSFRSYGDMGDGDDFWVVLSSPIQVRSILVTTGNGSVDRLTGAVLETSTDGSSFRQSASFQSDGTALASNVAEPVKVIRIRLKRGSSVAHLDINEIKIDSQVAVSHVQEGPPRGFVDISEAPDLADWAARAESQMESFWADADALLYTDKFIPPNAVNVVYRTGLGVTGVAATGGGVMTVNSAYARAHPKDTGLTVHEMAHVVQSGGSPGWLIEAVADYVRWIKFEPQNFTFSIDPTRATPHDPYRTGAAFLGWIELHYDSRIVTKLNEATRFGNYQDGLYEKYCGKSIDVLWKEFLTAYQTDRPNLFARPLPPAMHPRELPAVAGSSTDVPLPFEEVGVVADGSTFGAGFDGEGAAYSGNLLQSPVVAHGVRFSLPSPGSKNILPSNGQAIALSGAHKSVWLLAAAENGPYRNQELTVTYADGSSEKLYQNFSDWFHSESFPGELIATTTAYRDMSDGSRDNRAFKVYAYGYPLHAKELKSITLPQEPGIRILALELAD